MVAAVDRGLQHLAPISALTSHLVTLGSHAAVGLVPGKVALVPLAFLPGCRVHECTQLAGIA